MRLTIIFFLLSIAHSGFAQSSLKEVLLRDFAASRDGLHLVHPYWFANDTANISNRDTITFHNKLGYYLGAKGVCHFLTWSFTSKHTIYQSDYLPCSGHGYFVSALDGSGIYNFKVKESSGKTYMKLTNHKLQVSWFEVFRSLEHDSQNIAYPVMTLVRLKNKPV